MERFKTPLQLIGALAVGGLIVWTGWSFSRGTHDSLDSLSTSAVWMAGQRFVEQQLDLPQDAFWGWRTDEQPVRKLSNGHFVTSGWVRTENAQGEFEILNFECEIQRQAGEWKMIDLAVPLADATATGVDAF